MRAFMSNPEVAIERDPEGYCDPFGLWRHPGLAGVACDEARAILAETEPEVYRAETWDLGVFKRPNLKYHFLLAEAMGDASIWDADTALAESLAAFIEEEF